MLRQEYIFRIEAKYRDKIKLLSVPEKVNVRKDSVTIWCETHGEVSINAGSLLYMNRGCPECGKARSVSASVLGHNEIINRLSNRNKNREFEYIDIQEDIRIADIIKIKHNKCGLIFEQNLNAHLRGQGCPKCWRYTAGDKCRLGKEEIIKRCKESKEHSTIDYEKSIIPDNISVNDTVWFYCRIHGFFEQAINNHMNVENTCPKCGHKKGGDSQRIGRVGFIHKAKNAHGERRYDYSLLPEAFKMKDKVRIICNSCKKDFLQEAASHCRGIGCPHCGLSLSSWENDLYAFVTQELGFRDAIQKYRNWACDGRKEIDIFIPSLNYGIECNGVHWHSSDDKTPSPKSPVYHKEKQDEALSKGIKLFFLWDDVLIEENKSILSKVLSTFYVPPIKKSEDGLLYFDKDICPTKEMVNRNIQFIRELLPEPTIRKYINQNRLTYGSGLWVFHE